MNTKSLLLIVFIFYKIQLFSQVQINYPSIDKLSYEQYLNKDWKSLIKTGKMSLKKGIDFYYLQVRMGIAYYDLKKYPKAVKHFENAYKQNPDDEVIQEYLYFSYLFSGRYNDARVIASKFNRVLKGKLKISAEHPAISAVYIETKHDINEDYLYTPQSGENINQSVVTDQSYYNFSLEHLAGNRVTIFHGYSNVKITNEIADTDPYLPPLYKEIISQNEYYFSLKVNIATGFNLTGGFHFLNSKYYAPDPNPVTVGRWNTTTNALYNYSINSYAASLNLSKHFSNFNIVGGVSVSNLNSNFQFQPQLSLKLFPFGNSRFYTNSNAALIIENELNTQTINPVVKQSIGIYFTKYSMIEPSVTIGNMKNYTDYNAYIANNDINLTKRKYEILVNLGFSKGIFNVFLKYQYNIKENYFEINDVAQSKEYVNQSITGGIKWYFKKY